LSAATEASDTAAEPVPDESRAPYVAVRHSTGAVESIEVIGYAPVWGNSKNAIRESFRVAELEAKKSLNDLELLKKESMKPSKNSQM
jgi:hypothetical protein